MITITELILFLTLIIGVMLGAVILTKVMKSKKYKASFTVNTLLMVVTVTVFVLFDGLTTWTLTGIALSFILLYASIQDITNHEVDDFVWVMILLLAISNIKELSALSMIGGALIIFVPTFAFAFLKSGSIGGADIKISTSCGILLGFIGGAIGFCIGLVFAVVFNLLYNKIKKRDNTAFPMLPFLSVGFLIGYFI